MHDELNSKSKYWETLFDRLKDSEKCFYELYNSTKKFDDVRFHYDLDIYFCGIEFYTNLLRIKTKCTSYDDKDTKLYIKQLIINGISMMAGKYIDIIKACEYKNVFIDIYEANDMAIADFLEIKLKLSVELDNYEPECTCELYIVCNPKLGLFTYDLENEDEL